MDGGGGRPGARIVAVVRMFRGPRLDAAVAVTAAAVAAVTIMLGLPTDRPVAQWILVEASAVGLVLVRRAPVTALGLQLVLIVVTDELVPMGSHIAPLAAGVALGGVAYRRSGPVMTVGWVATFAVVLLIVVREDGNLLAGVDGLVRLLSLAAVTAAPVAFGCYLAGVRNAAAVAEERVREAEQRALVEREAARYAERARLSGDLHDLVAHHVSAIAMRAGSARYAAGHGGPTQERLDEAATALDAIHTSARQALVDLRGLLHVLRDPGGGEPLMNPEKMITDAVERSRSAGLEVRAELDERAAAAPLALRVTAARVVQEALTNALKHAGPGAGVAATVVLDGAHLRIDVANTLPAAPAQGLPASGHGLAGMRERVEILGGSLEAGPDGGGWRLGVTLPLEAGPA